MFREAGIDARIVLTRTRQNGDIRDLPASLAVFDHAIAYVPASTSTSTERPSTAASTTSRTWTKG
jgi:hypothetical protein